MATEIKIVKEEEHYLDSNHNVVKPKEASICLIRGFNSKNKLIMETWIDLKEK